MLAVLRRVRPVLRPRARLLAALVTLHATGASAHAQLIRIKTIPIAEGEQWSYFPSSNAAMGGLSIALADSLLDPFVNPAKGSRIGGGAREMRVFGSPTFYSLSRGAGGGQTLPLGVLLRSGATFGGIALAVQEIDGASGDPDVIFAPGGLEATSASSTSVAGPPRPSHFNRFAFATFGRHFADADLSLAASAHWSGIGNVDGVDQLYAGSQSVRQQGSDLDLRLGLLKQWAGGSSLEALVLHDRFAMRHDVSWFSVAWDPNVGTFVQQTRTDRNRDRTNTWGLHLGYMRPLADSGWRIGGILTANLMSHPELPEYEMAQLVPIPWDPGRSAAYDVGVGLAHARGLTTFGIDAVYEPIVSHTWGEAHEPIVGTGGTLPVGAMTTENRFRFNNALLRTGVARVIPVDSARGTRVQLQLGLDLRAIRYHLDQVDHVVQQRRTHDEAWTEWTRHWGLALQFSDLTVRYAGRLTSGTGRPGLFEGGFVLDGTARSSSFLPAPTGPLGLTDVRVSTHQLTVSVPIH